MPLQENQLDEIYWYTRYVALKNWVTTNNWTFANFNEEEKSKYYLKLSEAKNKVQDLIL